MVERLAVILRSFPEKLGLKNEVKTVEPFEKKSGNTVPSPMISDGEGVETILKESTF